MKKVLLAVGLLLATAGIALAAGVFQGFPTVFPVGTTGNQTVNGVSLPQGSYTTLPLTGNETIPADTNLTSGQNPATENITVNQITGYARGPVTLTDATDVLVNASTIGQSGLAMLTLTASGHTIDTPSNLTSGQQFIMEVTQGSGGSFTTTWAAIFAWAGGTAPTLSTTAGSVDVFRFIYDGTKVRGLANLNSK